MALPKLEKWQKICIALCGIGILFSILLFVPIVQNLILGFGENVVVHRPLTRPVWIGRFVKWGVELCVFFVVAGGMVCFWKENFIISKKQRQLILFGLTIIFAAMVFSPTFFYGFLFICVFYANGLFFSRKLGWKYFEFSLAFFVGIIIDGIYFSIIHLFFPLTIFTLIPVFLIAIYETIFQIAFEKIIDKLQRQKISFYALTLFFMVSLALALSVDNGGVSYDTYLYHASLVSWLNEYKIIPGLAALHGRLGMNSLYLIIAAGIDVGIFDKCASCILPFAFASATFIYFLRSFLVGTKDIKLYSVILIFWIFLYVNKNPSLYYDNPSLALGAIFILEIYKIIVKEKFQIPFGRIALSCLLAAGSFGMKQIGAIYVLVSFFVLARFCFIEKDKLGKRGIIKTLVYCTIIPFILAVVYVITNLIQTGFPLFPMTICQFDFPWTLPKENTQGVLDAILYWARKPCPGYIQAKYDFLFWFIPWIKNFLRTKEFLLLIFGIVIWAALIARTKIKFNIIFFFAITFASLIFWYKSAPDVRFGSAMFFVFFGLALAFIFEDKNFVLSAPMKKNISLIVLFAIFWGIVLNISKKWIIQFSEIDFLSVQKVKMFPCKRVLVQNGENPPLYIYIPEGDDDRTGDAPLPCAPAMLPNNFHLFEPGNLQKGFYFEK